MGNECRSVVRRPAVRAGLSAGCASLVGAALPPDLLVELHPVAALGGVATLLAADLPDPAEEFVAVAPFRGQPALPAGIGPAHLHLLGHILPFRPRSSSRVASVLYPAPPRATQPFWEGFSANRVD